MRKRLPLFMAVKKLRDDLHLTQEGLAEKSGISVGYIRHIESGYQALSDEFKEKLARALNISVWALFPDVKREVDLFNILKSRFGKDLMISETEEPLCKEVLSRVSEDEFDEFIASGTQPGDVKKLIKKFAADYSIEISD